MTQRFFGAGGVRWYKGKLHNSSEDDSFYLEQGILTEFQFKGIVKNNEYLGGEQLRAGW